MDKSDYIAQWHDIANALREENLKDIGWSANTWRRLKRKLDRVEECLCSIGVQPPARDIFTL